MRDTQRDAEREREREDNNKIGKTEIMTHIHIVAMLFFFESTIWSITKGIIKRAIFDLCFFFTFELNDFCTLKETRGDEARDIT